MQDNKGHFGVLQDNFDPKWRTMQENFNKKSLEIQENTGRVPVYTPTKKQK